MHYKSDFDKPKVYYKGGCICVNYDDKTHEILVSIDCPKGCSQFLQAYNHNNFDKDVKSFVYDILTGAVRVITFGYPGGYNQLLSDYESGKFDE